MKKLGFILVLITESFICNSQVWNSEIENSDTNTQNWISGIGISDKIVRDIIEYSEDTLLAGVDEDGIYISYDNGSHWVQFALQGETVYSLIKIGTSVLAGTYGNDIYKTVSIDSTWKSVSINGLVINALKLYKDTVYACTYGLSGPGSVYISSDTGNTWIQYITTAPYAYLDIDFNLNGRVYVATPFGAYYSDNRSPWTQTTGNSGTTRTVNYLGNDSIIYGV